MPVELTSGWKAALGLVSVPLRRGLIESGLDFDRQIKAHTDRGDGATVIFHAGARTALQLIHDLMTPVTRKESPA